MKIEDGDILENLDIIEGNEYYDSPTYRVKKYVGYRLIPTKAGSKSIDAEVFLDIAKHPVKKV